MLAVLLVDFNDSFGIRRSYDRCASLSRDVKLKRLQEWSNCRVL